MRKKRVLPKSGDVIHQLTLLKRSGTVDGKSVWKCLCSCGTIKNLYLTNIRSGSTKSCGCLRKQNKGRPIKLICNKGHELTSDNVYLLSKGTKVCKTCELERIRKRREK